MKENFKGLHIRCDSEEDVIVVQETLFKLDISWNSGSLSIMYKDKWPMIIKVNANMRMTYLTKAHNTFDTKWIKSISTVEFLGKTNITIEDLRLKALRSIVI